MDPALSSLSAVNALTQALLVRQGGPAGEVEALMKAVGQELAVRYLGKGTEGTRLEFPGGRIITAMGEVPFPEGTHLRVRITNENGALKLQTLEAKPPAASALLMPLMQSEAAPLMAQLQQTAPPVELASLVQILRTLMEAPAQEPPSLPVLAKAIAALPKDLALQLAKALGAEAGESPQALAQRILAGAENPLAHLQILLRQASMPPEARGELEAWLRILSGQRSPEVARELSSTPGNRILSHGDLTKVAAALRATTASSNQVPEVWEAWIKGSVRTLADPGLSPREAPFHALQGRENTGFFEVPMPWASSKAMQLWVEKDAPESQGLDSEPVTRMLLGLSLTRLGEIRIGLQRRGEALSVRIWAEHSELIEGQKSGIDQELHAIASAVDLRILPLEAGTNGTIPDIRSVVIGPSLHALG